MAFVERELELKMKESALKLEMKLPFLEGICEKVLVVPGGSL